MNFENEINELELLEFDDDYIIKKGNIPILFTAPHTMKQVKEDKSVKLNEPYTKAIALYLNKHFNVNSMIKIKDTGLDANRDNRDKFKTELKDKEVNKLIDIIKNKNNYIFTGDLNAIKNSKYINRISKYYTNHDTTNTWTTKPFSYNGFEVKELDYKLDYVFTSSGIYIKNIEVIDTKYSDHLPILCEID